MMYLLTVGFFWNQLSLSAAEPRKNPKTNLGLYLVLKDCFSSATSTEGAISHLYAQSVSVEQPSKYRQIIHIK